MGGLKETTKDGLTVTILLGVGVGVAVTIGLKDMTGREAIGGLNETAGIETCGNDEAVAEAVAVDVAVDVGVLVSGKDVDGLPGVVVAPAAVEAEGSAVTEASSVGAAVFVA